MRKSRRNLVIVAAIAVVIVGVTMARDNNPADATPTPARRGAPAAETATMPVADVKL